MVSSVHVEPVSRSDQYKRVMKPLLERKRRARINRCLDELRDLLVSVLQSEGEAVTRLEKADILELTVRHVRRLSQRRRLALPTPGSKQQEEREDVAKFQQGFVAAAQQVRSFLMSTNSLEPSVSSRLLTHLTSCATSITPTPSLVPSNSASPPTATVNSQVSVQVAKPVAAPRPPTNSRVVTNSDSASTVSPSNVLTPFLSTGSQTFQKSPPPPPVRIHQSVTAKTVPTYPLNSKVNLTQPLIDLSNHKSPACVYVPPIYREPPFPDRKIAPSPFIDVVSTENDSPDLVKSEFSTRPVQDSKANLQLLTKFMPNDSSMKMMHHLYSPGSESRSDSESSCSSPTPQDLSMKKNIDESGSSWRPW